MTGSNVELRLSATVSKPSVHGHTMHVFTILQQLRLQVQHVQQVESERYIFYSEQSGRIQLTLPPQFVFRQNSKNEKKRRMV